MRHMQVVATMTTNSKMSAPMIDKLRGQRQRWSAVSLRSAAAGLAILALGLGGARAEPPAAAGAGVQAVDTGQATDAGQAVVVELFTSQGCSTCPPADRLLTQLGSGAGAGQVIPLAFHVDYWNRLGWTDPFSSAEWSARQAKYGRALHVDNVYTPELVV